MLDLLYLLTIAVLSPWLAWRAVATGRYRRDLAAKLLGRVHVDNPAGKPVAWFHAVSVGEVTLLGTLVPAFRRRHPEYQVVVSATTDTGLAEARKRFIDLSVIPWPVDFSWAVGHALAAVNPSLVVLTESELWPTFLRAAARRRVPVVVANARMSPRSFTRLRRFRRWVYPRLLDRVTCFAAQEPEYADRLRHLGVPTSRVTVTGSIKYDGALKDRNPPQTDRLRKLLGLPGQSPPVWLAGSTHAPEEAIVLAAFRELRNRFPDLRLILVPRHPDRFEEVAALLARSGLPFGRRSRMESPVAETPAVVLLDTVGELGAAWGLADVGFTGGSLDGRRGGQSMIEPAGYGVPCVFGPHVWNFEDAAKRLVDEGGAVMVTGPDELAAAIAAILGDDLRRTRMGHAARDLVRRQQGATTRTLDAIDRILADGRLCIPA
jgi:3-deoxy-D-manno-octulosonic-acid transferase